MFASSRVPDRSPFVAQKYIRATTESHRPRAPLPEQVVQRVEEQVNRRRTITHKPAISIEQSTLPSLVHWHHRRRRSTRETGAGASARHRSYSRVAELFLAHSLASPPLPLSFTPSHRRAAATPLSLTLCRSHRAIPVAREYITDRPYISSSEYSYREQMRPRVHHSIRPFIFYLFFFFTSHPTRKRIYNDLRRPESLYAFIETSVIKRIFGE